VPAFISPSVSSVSITVTGIAQAVVVSLAPGSPQCSTTGDTRTCTVALKAPIGVDTFTATIYAGPNATGPVLGIGTTVLDITSTSGFSITISVSGSTASVRLSAARTQFTVGVPATTTITVDALDADGNLIAGAYEHPIVLTDSDTTGTFTISPATLTQSGTPVILSYSGGSAAKNATISASGIGISTSTLSTQTVTDVPPSPAPPSPTPAPPSPTPAPPSPTPAPAMTDLFGASQSGGVAEYTAASGALVQTFAGDLPVVLVGADDAANIYTFGSSAGSTQVSRFTIGANVASATFTPTSSSPKALSVAPAGEVIVEGSSGTSVVFDVWDAGASGSPSRTISYAQHDGTEFAYALGPDGSLYVAYRSASGAQMFDVIAPGASGPQRTMSETLASSPSSFRPNVMAATADGTLYVGEWTGSTSDPNAALYVFAPNGTESKVSSLDPGIDGIDFDGSGNVYVVSNNAQLAGSTSQTNDTAQQLTEYSARAAALISQIDDGVPGVGALTVGSDGTAYLVQYGGSARNAPAQGAVYSVAPLGTTAKNLIPATNTLNVVLYDGSDAKDVRTGRRLLR